MDNDKMVEMQMLDYQTKQIQQILETIDTQLSEVAHARNALAEFGALKGNEEAFFPIVNGIFVKGRLSENKIVRMNVGSGIVVEKSLTEAIIIMDKQYKEMDEYKEQLMNQLNALMSKAQDIE
jgi:prefoldin alpha subunit